MIDLYIEQVVPGEAPARIETYPSSIAAKRAALVLREQGATYIRLSFRHEVMMEWGAPRDPSKVPAAGQPIS